MSFADKQGSQYGGKPIRLYEFRIGRYPYSTTVGETGYDSPLLWGEAVYRLNDSEQDMTVTAGGVTDAVWTSGNISDSGFQFSGAATSEGYEVTMPAEHPLAAKFRGTPPAQTVALVVYDVHATDSVLEAQVVWVGEVAEVHRPAVEKVVLNCVTVAAAFQRMGLRLAWEKNCPHLVYDSQCKLDIRDHSIDTTVDAVLSGTQLTLGVALTDEYLGGMIYWTTDDLYEESIGITEISGTTVTVFGLTDKITAPQDVKVAKGCARTVAACTAFANLNNYGGAPHLPERNPFDGQPLF